MSDFVRALELLRQSKAELNALYKEFDGDNEILNSALGLLDLSGSNSEKIAVLRRIVDLKEEPLENELKKLGKSEREIEDAKKKMFVFVREFYENRHDKLIKKIEQEGILDEFDAALVRGVHSVGVAINAWQQSWERQILQTTNKEFKAKFKDFGEALKFIDENGLFQPDRDGAKADRSYGAVVKTGEKYEFKPYALAFSQEVCEVGAKFDEMIANLQGILKRSGDFSASAQVGVKPSGANLQDKLAYINYLNALKNAFCEQQNERVIKAWQEAEIAWMAVKSPLQVGHPLEYYEDAYTHAVALEWDIRLAETSGFDEAKFKREILDTYAQICAKIGANDESLNAQVGKNVSLTQVYISNPMIYYGAELNGLFSAQVVPNDEFVSKMCGKKIFAFVTHVYESAKARPFMRLSGEIFGKEFLDFGREILFCKPDVWKKVYEISTIGHEFGHILFVGEDTERLMNRGGEFKFIEEYKATTGGLVNFFLHEDERFKMPVFHELIARAVGLIAWREVGEVRAYYCEGLIHLSLLFEAGVLGFDGAKLSVNFSKDAYEKFKEICLKNYENLALHYAKKREAGEFLAKFCRFDGTSYMPTSEQAARFVEFYYARYKQIGNEIDESGEWRRWQELGAGI